MPPPEPDPRPPPPPPEPLPAPAAGVGLGPRIFVVRRAAPQIPLRPQLAPPIPRLQPQFARPPIPQQLPVQPPQQQPMDILQEILRQQQVLRIQQDAVQQLHAPIPAAAVAANPAADAVPAAVPQQFDNGAVLPDAPPPMPLNALQGWQLQWQHQQQQELQHLQPFLADPPLGGQRPARPGLPAPPGAVQA